MFSSLRTFAGLTLSLAVTLPSAPVSAQQGQYQQPQQMYQQPYQPPQQPQPFYPAPSESYPQSPGPMQGEVNYGQQAAPPDWSYRGEGYPQQQALPPGYPQQNLPPPQYAAPSYPAYPGQFTPQGDSQPPAGYAQQGAMPVLQGHVIEAPAGLIIPISLQTAISTQVAKAGDYIQATVSQEVYLSNGSIPSGATVSGTVTDATAGKHFNRTGVLSITFNQIRTPDGSAVPIAAHLIGDIGKYAIGKNGEVKGEGWGTKLGGIGLRTAVGAGGGAALGTAMGAITGGGIGTGAWAGTAIGGGLGLAEATILRKGRNVIIPSGTAMQLQLDQPASMTASASTSAPPPGQTGM